MYSPTSAWKNSHTSENMDVCNERKRSLIPVTFEDLKGLTVKTSLLDVTNGGKVFTCPTTLKRHKGT
jgi:hypothetical protein